MNVGDTVREKRKSTTMKIQEIGGGKAKCLLLDRENHDTLTVGSFAIADLELVRRDKFSEKKTEH